nr:MAG TPA: hypothetical protein [Caudoviricetes sp.]
MRQKIQQRTNAARGTHGFVGNFDTGFTQYAYP